METKQPPTEKKRKKEQEVRAGGLWKKWRGGKTTYPPIMKRKSRGGTKAKMAMRLVPPLGY